MMRALIPGARRLKRAAAAAVACALVAAVGAACGSAGSTGTSTAAGGDLSCVAGKEVSTALPTELPAGYTPLAKPPAKGGSLIYVGNNQAASTPDSATAFKKAAAAIGWSFELLSYDGSVQDFDEKLNHAIDKKPTVIAEQAVPVAAFGGPLARAKQEGIVVVAASISDRPTGATGLAGLTHDVAAFDSEADTVAHWIMADSHCSANVAFVGLNIPIFSSVAGPRLVKTITDGCKGCKAVQKEMSTADIGTPAGIGGMVSILQADPGIDYLVVATAGQATGLDAALVAAGITDVKVVGLTAPDVNALKALQDKKEAMWLSSTAEMASWTLLDAALRVLDTDKPVSGLPYPVAVLTQDNVPADAKKVPTYPLDYEAAFVRLWTGK